MALQQARAENVEFTMDSSTEEALIRAAAKELRCTICFEAFTDPVSLQCSHVFCRGCIMHSIAQVSPHCPLCNGRADARTIVALPLVNAFVDLARRAAEKRGIEDIMETQIATRLRGYNSMSELESGSQGMDENVVGRFEALTQGVHMAKTHTAMPAALTQKLFDTPTTLRTAEDESPLGHIGSPLLEPKSRKRQRPDNSDASSLSEATSLSPTHSVEFPTVKSGKCTLCHLDTSDHEQMRKFLKMIVEKDASCRKKELLALDQLSAETMLGELCGPFSTAKKPTRRRGGPIIRYAHYLCLLWSPEVFVRNGRLIGTQNALRRGVMIKCAFCGARGATLGCANARCRKSFHIPCAHLSGPNVCTLDEASFELHCAAHRPQVANGAQ